MKVSEIYVGMDSKKFDIINTGIAQCTTDGVHEILAAGVYIGRYNSWVRIYERVHSRVRVFMYI